MLVLLIQFEGLFLKFGCRKKFVLEYSVEWFGYMLGCNPVPLRVNGISIWLFVGKGRQPPTCIFVYMKFCITLPKMNSKSPLNSMGWKTIDSLWDGLFSGAMFRERFVIPKPVSGLFLQRSWQDQRERIGGLGRLVVWIPGIPENERDCYLGVTPRIPNHRAPNHQFTIGW